MWVIDCATLHIFQPVSVWVYKHVGITEKIVYVHSGTFIELLRHYPHSLYFTQNTEEKKSYCKKKGILLTTSTIIKHFSKTGMQWDRFVFCVCPKSAFCYKEQ